MDKKSLDFRKTILKCLYRAGAGHMPSAYSCLEIVRVLYDSILQLHPHDPLWVDRDRCILSKGHGCLALYTVLADKGFFPREDLEHFLQFESHLGGHPERGLTPGVEATTGSLGHGPSIGVGMALAARMDKRTSRVFVLCGDGETNEGSVWEACLSASKYKLDNLTLIIDYNKMQSWDSVAAITPLEPYVDKFTAFGFAVKEVDGHDVHALTEVFGQLPFAQNKPSVVICHTVKGKGIASVENNLKWHHKNNLSEQEYLQLLAELDMHA